jgi:hypothetical protein
MDDFSSIGSSNTALSRQEAWVKPSSSSHTRSSSHGFNSTPRSRASSTPRGAAPENLGRSLPPAPPMSAPASRAGPGTNSGGGHDGRVPHHKAGRVKVGIRCRPAFNDELQFAAKRGEPFSSIVGTREEGGDQELGQVCMSRVQVMECAYIDLHTVYLVHLPY